MTKVIFIENGERKEIEAQDGLSILEVAHQNNIDLEGACEGSLACSTCHVIVKEQADFDKLEEASEAEEDMLDLAFGVTGTSRLGCQIIVGEDIKNMEFIVPSETRNIS